MSDKHNIKGYMSSLDETSLFSMLDVSKYKNASVPKFVDPLLK